jgi:hypothetical protein
VRDLTAHGGVNEPSSLAERVVQQALSEATSSGDTEMTMRRVRVVRYRRRLRRDAERASATSAAPLTHAQLRDLLQPRNRVEQGVYRAAASVGHSLLAVARHRYAQLRARDARLRVQMREAEAGVIAWLGTLVDGRLDLASGSLRTTTTTAAAAGARSSAKVTDATIVRVSAALLTAQQPVALVQRVQASLRRLRGGKRARVS